MIRRSLFALVLALVALVVGAISHKLEEPFLPVKGILLEALADARSAAWGDSPLLSWKTPTAAIAVRICATLAAFADGPCSPQLSFRATSSLPRNSVITGSPSVPATPNSASPGPTARSNNRRSTCPLSTNPGIKIFAPVPTTARLDKLISRPVPGFPNS